MKTIKKALGFLGWTLLRGVVFGGLTASVFFVLGWLGWGNPLVLFGSLLARWDASKSIEGA